MTEVLLSGNPDDVSEEDVRSAVLKTVQSESANIETVTVAFIAAHDMRQLNLRYRGKDAATDVLSFPFDASFPTGSGGEMYICTEVCRTHSGHLGREVSEEVLHMVIHGTLHLIGYTDETDEQLEVMEAKTRRILKSDG
jgi:probable rRNA maturation factor